MPKAFGGLGVTTGLAADRTSLTGMVAGQQFYETDTGIMYLYTGSVWSIFMPQASNFVTAETTTSYTQSSSSYGATPLSASITKVYSSSSILVQVNASLAAYHATSGESYCNARIIETNSNRNKDFLRVVRSYDNNSAGVVAARCPLTWLDTVAGTGNRTYRLDIAQLNGTSAEFNMWANGIALSNIFLSEVF